VPDSEHYDVSWTDFQNEKLEQHNWNHVDHFLISRGDDDHGLMEVSNQPLWHPLLFGFYFVGAQVLEGTVFPSPWQL
jgi:hypothetical protein